MRIFPGFHTPAAQPATLNLMCHVLQNRVLRGAVISHTTAAALLGIPVPWWVDGRVGLLAGAAYVDAAGETLTPSTLPSSSGISTPGGSTPRAGADLAGAGHSNIRTRRTPITPITPITPQSGIRPRQSIDRYERLIAPPTIHCRVPGSSTRSAGPHVVVHRKGPSATVTWRGLVLSHPHVVLLELATLLEHDEIVAAVDRLIGRNPPLPGITLTSISDAVTSFRGLPGAPALRRALGDARPGTDSPGESRTRLLLMRAGFPEPTPNLRVRDPDTGRPRYIDLAYPDQRIGIEYDGLHHQVNAGQWREDHARRDSLASIGWTLRFLNANDIASPARFLSALRRSFLHVSAAAPHESNWTGSAGHTLARPRRGARPSTARRR